MVLLLEGRVVVWCDGPAEGGLPHLELRVRAVFVLSSAAAVVI